MAFRRYSIGGVTDHPIEPLDPARRSSQTGPDTLDSEESKKQSEESKKQSEETKKQLEGRDFEKSEAIAAYSRPRLASERKPAVRAEQIMSSPIISIEPDTRISEARKMVNERRFRHVPVVSKDGLIRGIVSDRDLFTLSGEPEVSTPSIVEDIMTKYVLTATPNTGIREIARVLFEERIGCMPIVDEDGVVVGIITRSDILRALIKHAPLNLWI